MKKPTDKRTDDTFDRTTRRQLLNSFDHLEKMALIPSVDLEELYRSMPAGRDLESIRKSLGPLSRRRRSSISDK